MNIHSCLTCDKAMSEDDSILDAEKRRATEEEEEEEEEEEKQLTHRVDKDNVSS
jgi:hypothetical protein